RGVDVEPAGRGDETVHWLSGPEQAGVRLPDDTEGRPGVHPVEDAWLEHVQAGGHETPEGAFEDAPGVTHHAPHPAVAVQLDHPETLRVGRRPHDHGDDPLASLVVLEEPCQRQLEEAVTVGDDERLAREQRLRPLYAAARIENFRLPGVSHAQPEAAAIAD